MWRPGGGGGAGGRDAGPISNAVWAKGRGWGWGEGWG